MTAANTTVIEVLKAHLRSEGLCLCKAGDTTFPLDGMRELEALNGVVELVSDVEEWAVDAPTTPIPPNTLAALRATICVADCNP